MYDNIYTDLTALDDAQKALLKDTFPPLAAFVDARHLRCPMPLLKTKIALNQLTDGACLYLVATDSNAGTDLGYFCQKNGHSLTHWADEIAPFHALIHKNTQIKT